MAENLGYIEDDEVAKRFSLNDGEEGNVVDI